MAMLLTSETMAINHWDWKLVVIVLAVMFVVAFAPVIIPMIRTRSFELKPLIITGVGLVLAIALVVGIFFLCGRLNIPPMIVILVLSIVALIAALIMRKRR